MSTQSEGLALTCKTAKSELSDDVKLFYENEICYSGKKCEKVCKDTVKQSLSALWFKERRLRISATKVHCIARSRHPETRLKYFFGNTATHKNMIYGQTTEPIARQKFQELTGTEVVEVGLIIKSNQPWLSASPDGLFCDSTGNLAVLEIKCPITCKDSKIVVDYLDKNDQLKTTHSYYTQVQILLYVTGAKVCYFFVYSSCDQKIVLVKYDKQFL